MDGFLHPFRHLTLRSFCTQGLPGVAESTFQKAKENLHPWGEVPGRVDEGGDLTRVCLHPPFSTVPLLLKGKASLRDVDSATSPSASRRMTGLGGIL